MSFLFGRRRPESHVRARIGRYEASIQGGRRGKVVEIVSDGKVADTIDVEMVYQLSDAPLILRNGGAMTSSEVSALRDFVSPYLPGKNRRIGNRIRGSANRRFIDEHGFKDYSSVHSMDDLRDFVLETNPEAGLALRDPEVWAWICDYYAYVAWNEHGNEPSLYEDAENGYILYAISDLTAAYDDSFTEYLTDQGDFEGMNDRQWDLLKRRQQIQRRYGVSSPSIPRGS